MTMHLRLHHGSTFPACDPQLAHVSRRHVPAGVVVVSHTPTTMNPADVTCGNCVRTTLYHAAVRATQTAVTVDSAINALKAVNHA